MRGRATRSAFRELLDLEVLVVRHYVLAGKVTPDRAAVAVRSLFDGRPANAVTTSTGIAR